MTPQKYKAEREKRGTSFAAELNTTAASLTAAEAARAVSPVLSHRTMEDWLQNRRTPPAWIHHIIIIRVSVAAKKKAKKAAIPEPA